MIKSAHSRGSFIKTSASFAAGTLMLSASLLNAQSGGSAKPLMAYVGTYTSPLKNMLSTQVDRVTGALTPDGIHEMGTSPSALAFNADRTRLYSANETERIGPNEAGSVSVFAINSADGKLKLLNTVSSGGKGPAHPSVHPSGKFVLVANYFGGSVAVLPIKADGSLGEATDINKALGSDQSTEFLT
jgi:6-phosphogluconolactonase